MNQCCDACQKLLTTGTTHADLILLSEVTGSKIFKCQNCKTYMHFVLGVWEVFMAGPTTYRKVEHSPQIKW
ncbi:MAG: hypothetical protein HRU06_21180 [Oceanospirillaceae bacterium]|nr:hypothetical protein [Oceanospirillaceae bacterium]